jgi:hypothetical protein
VRRSPGAAGILAACVIALLGLVSACSGDAPKPLADPVPDLPEVPGGAPRLAVAWLVHDDFDPEALARFDVVIVDMEWTHRDPAGLRRLREENPDVTLLAYVGSQEIMDPDNLASVGDGFRFRKAIAAGIDPSWYLRDGAGDPAVFYPRTWMLNPTTEWPDYLARFVSRNVLSSGLWDGIFYDNAWSNPEWLQDGDIDLDQDGEADGEEHGRRWIAEAWNDGIIRLFARTRELAGQDITLLGNGSAAGQEDYGARYSPRHHEYLNGAFDEHWPTLNRSWPDAIRRAEGWLGRARPPAFFVEQADPNGDVAPTADLRGMRFALASALLTEAHFAYDSGDHAQDDWWYDEFDGGGKARGYLGHEAGARFRIGDGVWAREFDGGLAIANPTDGEQTVTLPDGPWEFIRGSQDPEANPGGPATEVTLAPRDGRILLRAGGAATTTP